MRPDAGIAFVLLLLIFAWSAPRAGQEMPTPLRTDLNVVTAIDVSGSIALPAERLELLGLAEALVHPAFLQAVEGGMHQRIGFAAFTWSSLGDFVELVPWTVIGSRADAEEVAERLRSARSVPRFGATAPWQRALRRPWRTGLGTDISAAIEHGMDVLRAPPFVSERAVLNVCANGKDNIRDGPDHARDLAGARGLVINGLTLGRDPTLARYFREHVQIGPGSFVIEARELEDIAGAMLRKLVAEIAWLRPPP